MKASTACLSMRCLAFARRILACPLMLKFQQATRGVLSRAANLALCMQAGMTSINDFATTYMCQSLPFGGVKDSGFDRFAGIEGLRGMCTPKAVCEDRSASLQHPPCAGPSIKAALCL